MVPPAHGRRRALTGAARNGEAGPAGLSAPVLMMLATLLFAAMGVGVKYASSFYATGEIVFYRGLVGALAMTVLARRRGIALRTAVPAMHLWRCVVGVTALGLWFYAIGGLPLATAMTLNYMSSVWMAVFLIGGAVMLGLNASERPDGRVSIDPRLIATVLVGFVGVALILRPTIERDQLWHGLLGLMSGVLSALAYLQVTALGRVGEPEPRVVFYFSLGGMTAGLATLPFTGFTTAHTLAGVAALLVVGLSATAAQVMMTRAYAIGRPLVNASLQYLGIAYAFGFGVLLFDDPVTPMALAGTALVIGAGLAATQLRSHVAPKDASASTLET